MSLNNLNNYTFNNMNNRTSNSSNSNNSNQIVLDNYDDSYEIKTQQSFLGSESNYQSINRFYDDLITNLGLAISINKHYFDNDDETFQQTFENNCKALGDAIFKMPPMHQFANNLENYNNFTKNLEKYNNITCTLYKDTSMDQTIQNGLACIQKSISLSKWASLGTQGEKRQEALNRIIHAVKYNHIDVSLYKVHVLDLSELNLTDAPPNIGYFLPSLKVLDLSKNQITKLDQNVFKSLDKLKRVYLQDNQFNQQTVLSLMQAHKALGYVGPQYELSINDYYKNWISSGTQGEKRQEAIKCIIDAVNNKKTVLNLSKLNLKNVPPNIGYFLPSLEVLDLKNNQINNLDSTTFKSLTNLEKLYLYNNQINNLDQTIFEYNKNLRILNLYDNQIVTLDPSIFQSLTNLEELILSFNQIATLDPTTFQSLTNLKSLDLYDNQLVQFELSDESKKSLNNACVKLQDNPFTPETMQSLMQAQSVMGYEGPWLVFFDDDDTILDSSFDDDLDSSFDDDDLDNSFNASTQASENVENEALDLVDITVDVGGHHL